MSLEQMRTEFAERLINAIPADYVETALKAFDLVAVNYDVKRAETALSVIDGVPEVVKYFIAAKAVEHKAATTLYGYKRELCAFFNTLCKPFTDVSTNDIRVYLYSVKELRNVQDTTLEHLRVVINSFFNWCVQQDYLPKNPAAKIAPIKCVKKVRHALSMMELEKMRAACITKRQKALIDFLFSTGCRVSEVVDADISDVNWETNTFLVRCGKGGKQRVVYLNAESVVSLKAYLDSRKDTCPSLFVSTRCAHKMAVKSFEREIEKISALSGVGGVHPHILRHTMATVAMRNGMPVEQVKEVLGHESLDTTLIYAEVDRAAVAMNHKKYVA